MIGDQGPTSENGDGYVYSHAASVALIAWYDAIRAHADAAFVVKLGEGENPPQPPSV